MFGINVALKGYGSSLLPALLLAIVAYYVEKFLNKVIPGVFKPIFVGTLTMAATYAVSILALAPLGQLAGTYVTAAILWLYNIAGPHHGCSVYGSVPLHGHDRYAHDFGSSHDPAAVGKWF